MTNCLFFGDSITYGEYDGILGGWVDDLKRFYHLKYYNENAKEVNIFNLGIGGETTEGLLKRLKTETGARISPDENLIFFFYGANDLAIKENKEVVSLERFEENMLEAIEYAKRITAKVFLISILPVSQAVDGITVSSGKLRSTQRIALYNEKLRNIAAENGITFIDIYPVFNVQKETLLSRDGVHPNEKGYALISGNVKPVLEKHV
jgi:lysophospholipase L1-like esterase